MKSLVDARQQERRPPHRRQRRIILLAGLFACLVIPTRARAGAVIKLTEVGGDVVATATGTINLTALIKVESGIPAGNLLPAFAAVQVGSVGNGEDTVYTGISGPASFGSGMVLNPSISAAGDFLGVVGNLGGLEVSSSYVSGAPISGTSTWLGTFSSRGLTPGTYTYTWGSGSTADELTVNVVPEPATLWLAVIGNVAVIASSRFAK
jgi:hypothetical protein